MPPTVSVAVSHGVATFTLNRPEARNAVNAAMCDALRKAAEDAAGDAAVKLVLVRGAGLVFCAGADVKERTGMSADEVRARR
ncbi:MAG TPA: enoyl-CoA hydratase/isomerase family protein, partial [Burkholderiales bacterium]|nr:enoyl-CoA hydratase/isomerase family protein [Burkholderiales bacterium]